MSKRSRWVVGLLALAAMSPAMAATQDIAVTADGDRVYWRQWYYGGNDRGWSVDADPNQVSHAYEPGWGSSNETALTFNLAPVLGIPVADISAVTLNFNIVAIWTEGRDDVANLSTYGTVLHSGGTGMKFIDVTAPVKTAIEAAASTVDFYFSYTGYSGFTFSSAEGGNPAFLRIESVGAVPEPRTYALWLAGLGMMAALGARRGRQPR